MKQHVRVQVTTAEAIELKRELSAHLLAAVKDFEVTTGCQIADISLGKNETFDGNIETIGVTITALLA